MMYNIIIQPHVDFCSPIVFMATEEEMNDLQIIRNRALRLILKKGPRTRTSWMLNTLGIMSVKQRVYMNTLCLIYKMKNSMLPEYKCVEILMNHQATEYLGTQMIFVYQNTKKLAHKTQCGITD
jgi:hypothetical protein